MSSRSSMSSLLRARLLSRWCTRLFSQKNLRLSLRYSDTNFFQSHNILDTTTLLCRTKWYCRVSFTSCTDITSTSLTRRTNLDSSSYGIVLSSSCFPRTCRVCFVHVLGSSPPSLPVLVLCCLFMLFNLYSFKNDTIPWQAEFHYSYHCGGLIVFLSRNKTDESDERKK